jgi:hypothetical protein
VPNVLVKDGQQIEIELLGEMISARLYIDPLFDPKNEYLSG